MVSNPEDPNKSTPKKMYYMACGFCRWTTRDVNIADKSVASGGWEDLENPDAKRIFSLLEQYQQIAQKEKAEKERKKYVRRRSYMTYAASMDKYGLTSVAAKRKSLSTNVSNMSLKENEEAVITQLKPAEPTGEFEPLPEDVFTQPLLLDKISTISQRHATPEFQPSETTSMYPVHKHLLIRRSLRCKECEHNLCKPEFNPISIKFKIQLVALLHIPEIRIFAPTDLVFKKETKVILTVCNPAAYNTTIELKKMDPESDDFSNSKAELPKKEIILSRRDDAAIYDDGSQGQEAFKDDHNIVPFRKANKIGVIVKVTPQVQKENVKTQKVSITHWFYHIFIIYKTYRIELNQASEVLQSLSVELVKSLQHNQAGNENGHLTTDGPTSPIEYLTNVIIPEIRKLEETVANDKLSEANGQWHLHVQQLHQNYREEIEKLNQIIKKFKEQDNRRQEDFDKILLTAKRRQNDEEMAKEDALGKLAQLTGQFEDLQRMYGEMEQALNDMTREKQDLLSNAEAVAAKSTRSGDHSTEITLKGSENSMKTALNQNYILQKELRQEREANARPMQYQQPLQYPGAAAMGYNQGRSKPIQPETDPMGGPEAPYLFHQNNKQQYPEYLEIFASTSNVCSQISSMFSDKTTTDLCLKEENSSRKYIIA
ncbi:hypothetical protein KUTeg_003104 [Tegillarca granosa]|uniref:Dynactin subunit 4 n=1 Tax=Tegillarca granosa TaxID=220873 RepID=A0ABQ9FQN0_TEGGR|nr:hypothetical protein KUTeg_003104 [Tegillarca granosa]